MTTETYRTLIEMSRNTISVSMCRIARLPVKHMCMKTLEKQTQGCAFGLNAAHYIVVLFFPAEPFVSTLYENTMALFPLSENASST